MESKKNCCNINYDTLPYKLHFMLFCGAKGGILPYLVVFLKDKLNLSAATLATMLVVRSFVIVILKPTIGIIVDYSNKLKLVMICLTAGEIIFYYILLMIPRIERTAKNIPQTFLKDNEFLNNDYFYASLQKDLNDFTIFLQDQEPFKNTSKNCLKFNITVECNDSVKINQTQLTNCFLILNDMNKSLRVTIYNKLWLNSTTFSDTDKNIYFNCSSHARDEKDKNLIACKEIDLQNSKNHTADFSYENISNIFSFFPRKINCLWLNEIDGSSEVRCIKPTVHFDDENTSNNLQVKTKSVYSTYQYWLCGLIWILAGVCSNAMFTLSDTACYECLQRTGKDYGRQRLWGAVSWGLISPATGFLNDLLTGDSEVPNYTPGFYIFGILSIIEIMNLQRLDIVKPPRSSSFFKDFKKIFESKEFDVFVTAVFVIGFFTSFVWYYLMVYVESIGGNHLLMGLLNTSQCFLGEIPFMFYSGWITKKLGHMQVLITSFTFFALRFLCYYSIYNPWCLLPVEAMHGLTYGIFYTAMTAFGKVSAAPGTEATVQSVLCTTYEGLGVGVGSIVSGVCFEHFGYRTMFLLASICSLGCAICLYLVSTILKTKAKTIELTPKIK